MDPIATFYGGSGRIADAIAEAPRQTGKDINSLRADDLVVVDEFHIRGRKATLELVKRMNIAAGSGVLDIGSGLGGPARTVAQTFDCHVTGIDLTPAFCQA